jgi:hypothetical protein
MSNDHDEKAVDGQQKGDGFPGDGAIEWTGEPSPADVVAAASAAAEAVAAATAASVAAGSTGSRGHRPQPPAETTRATPAAPPVAQPTAAPVMQPVAPPAVTPVVPVPPALAVPVAAATTSAATTAAATTAPFGAEASPDPVRPAGSATIGGYRPWAAALDPMPEPKRTLPSRRLMALGGGVALVIMLIAAALLSGFAGGGSHGAAPVTPTQGGVSAASASAGAATSALATDSGSANESASPSAASSPTVASSPSASAPASTAGPVTASTVLAADRGVVVSSDNFKNSHSGWPLPKANSAVTTYQFTSDGYAIGSRTGTLEHLVYAPYTTAQQQLSLSITATQTGAPKGAGFGVTCRRGSNAAQISYTMVVLNNGTYYVERYDGIPVATSNPKALRRGQSPVSPGSTAITVVGMCATIAPGTTRVALFVNGQLLADVTDTAVLAGSGWTAGIDMASGKTTSTLVATAWQERDLSK